MFIAPCTCDPAERNMFFEASSYNVAPAESRDKRWVVGGYRLLLLLNKKRHLAPQEQRIL